MKNRVLLLFLPALALLFLYLIFFRWTDENQVARAQAGLIESIEASDWSDLRSLISEDYSDSRKWTKRDAVEAIRDARSLFVTLSLQPEDERTVITGEAATVTSEFRAEGITRFNQAKQRINQSGPIEFEWKKTSFWPWSWKLVRVKSDELEIPSGYRPGSLRERLKQ